MTKGALLLAIAGTLCGCEAFSEVVPRDELTSTERGVFTASGRFFVIGERPDRGGDADSWIVEITAAAGRYEATPLVAAALEGTTDGALGETARGDACVFSGLASHGELLYAACVARDGSRSALLQVDLHARSVRAGYFTSCNAEPPAVDCQFTQFYPNGMAVDAAGRIYLSDSFAHASELTGGAASHTLLQVSVDTPNARGAALTFRHRPWLQTDAFRDGLIPNGVQIEGDVLYYAAGSNINKVRIRADGSAGELRVHYAGPVEIFIDDFAVRDQQLILAQLLPPALVGLSPAAFTESARVTGSYAMPLDTAPSSVALPPPTSRLFAAGELVLTCYWGGGVQILPRSALSP